MKNFFLRHRVLSFFLAALLLIEGVRCLPGGAVSAAGLRPVLYALSSGQPIRYEEGMEETAHELSADEIAAGLRLWWWFHPRADREEVCRAVLDACVVDAAVFSHTVEAALTQARRWPIPSPANRRCIQMLEALLEGG